MPRLNLQQTSHSQFNYRITDDLRTRLTNAARANKRSLTQEITDRLESSFVDHDRAALIAENNAMLKALCAYHRLDIQ
ncbi:Arc family DNA-binding protein [Salmonella enterica]|jgi:hypothetical protein|nr:Arc family DNA-binding protein [Salmonella enterica]EMD8841604.1 Arc family DNA-binding protein [Salmonella enterica]